MSFVLEMIIPGFRIGNFLSRGIPGNSGEILSLLVWYINVVTPSTKYLKYNKKEESFFWIIRYNFRLLNACR